VPLDPRVQLPLFARRAGGAGGEEDAALLAGAMGEWRLQAEQPGAEWWWWWAEEGGSPGADADAPDAGATGALGGVVGGGVVRWDAVDALLDEAARLQAEGVGAAAAGPVCTAVTEAAGVRALHQALASGGAGGGRRGDGGAGYPFSEQEEGEWLLEAVEGWLSAGALSPCRVMLAALACLGERPPAGEGGEGFARGASAAARGAAGGAVVLHSFAAELARSAPAAAPREGDGCAEEAAKAPAARAWPGDGSGVMELELSGGDELVGVDVSGEGWVQVALGLWVAPGALEVDSAPGRGAAGGGAHKAARRRETMEQTVRVMLRREFAAAVRYSRSGVPLPPCARPPAVAPRRCGAVTVDRVAAADCGAAGLMAFAALPQWARFDLTHVRKWGAGAGEEAALADEAGWEGRLVRGETGDKVWNCLTGRLRVSGRLPIACLGVWLQRALALAPAPPARAIALARALLDAFHPDGGRSAPRAPRPAPRAPRPARGCRAAPHGTVRDPVDGRAAGWWRRSP